VLLHGISEPVVTLLVLVLCNTLFETPVVGKTSYSCMLSKVRPLDVVGVQFIPVGSVDQHESQEIVFVDEFKLIQKLVGYFIRLSDKCPSFSKFSVAVPNPLLRWIISVTLTSSLRTKKIAR